MSWQPAGLCFSKWSKLLVQLIFFPLLFASFPPKMASHCLPFLPIIYKSSSGNKLSFCRDSCWHPRKIKVHSRWLTLCRRGHSVTQTVLQSLLCSTSVPNAQCIRHARRCVDSESPDHNLTTGVRWLSPRLEWKKTKKNNKPCRNNPLPITGRMTKFGGCYLSLLLSFSKETPHKLLPNLMLSIIYLLANNCVPVNFQVLSARIDVKWKNNPSTGTQRGFKSQSYPKFCLCTVGCFATTLLTLTFNWEWSSGRVCFFYFFIFFGNCIETYRANHPRQEVSCRNSKKEGTKKCTPALKSELRLQDWTDLTNMWHLKESEQERYICNAFILSHKPCKNIIY